ncbi:hypothetical protein DPMN_113141 [Dreissena polymorpha]|uniref:Uncharacterized protein n=1 Tax=Dreissena polymorpha TaxID=45954 RepID=A0A9D4KH12_DREPO|nr:hypothetical protein DPMN_113141 [Dreissena polymorpha]
MSTEPECTDEMVYRQARPTSPEEKQGLTEPWLHLWQAKCNGVPNPPTTLQRSVAYCDSQLYTNIYTCERSINKTKIINGSGQVVRFVPAVIMLGSRRMDLPDIMSEL